MQHNPEMFLSLFDFQPPTPEHEVHKVRKSMIFQALLDKCGPNVKYTFDMFVTFKPSPHPLALPVFVVSSLQYPHLRQEHPDQKQAEAMFYTALEKYLTDNPDLIPEVKK